MADDPVTQDNAGYREELAREVAPPPDLIRFSLGDIVFHKTASSGEAGIVIGILVQPGCYKYAVRWDNFEDMMHFDFELCKNSPFSDSDRDTQQR